MLLLKAENIAKKLMLKQNAMEQILPDMI